MRPPPAAGEVAAIELRRRADLRPWRGARRLKELGGARRRRGPPRRGRRTRRGGAARGGSGARSAGREEGRADPARSSPARAATRARPTAREEGRARPAHSSPARAAAWSSPSGEGGGPHSPARRQGRRRCCSSLPSASSLPLRPPSPLLPCSLAGEREAGRRWLASASSFLPPTRTAPLLLLPSLHPRGTALSSSPLDSALDGAVAPSQAGPRRRPLPCLASRRAAGPRAAPSPARGRSRAWPWRAAGMAAAARATRGHGWSGHASRRRAAVLLGALPACASTPAPGYSPPLPRPRHGAAVAAVSGTAADGLPFSAPSRWPAARAPSSLSPSARAGHGELRRARTAAAVPASSAGGRSSACMRRGCGGDESDVWVPHVSGSRERARNRSQGYYCPFVFQFNCSVSIFDTNGIEGMEN